MRILYVNRRLAQRHSAPGLWGRQVLEGLRRAGATVASLPASDASPASERHGGATRTHPVAGPDGAGRGPSRFRSQFSRRWMAPMVEAWMACRGAAHSIYGLLWALWHGRRIEADVVLGRQAEYEATSQLVALALGRPLVLEVHSIHFIERQMRGRSASRLLRAFERWQWRRATRIWVNSDQLKSLIVDHGIPDRVVRVISFGVDLDRFAPARRANRAGGEIRVVFVGSFFDWHGTEVLLRAFAAAHARVPDLRLTLLGDGRRRRPDEALARELGVAEAVEFTGWLPNEGVIARLGQADIGVAPYLAMQPFYFDPAKIIEYMAAGLTVLASDQGRVAEMIENGVSGLLLPPGDEAALAAALVRLAADRDLRERMGAAARRRAETMYSWPEISKAVLALCAEAVGAGAAGRV